MRRALAVGFFLVVGIGATACGNKGGDDSGKKATTSQPVTTATVKATATAATTAAATVTATAKPAPPPLPAGRSAAPTLDEWAKMPKEVTVKGSSALKCETKILREYLRVSCKGKVDPEGDPRGIKILKGGHGEAFAYAGEGVISLVMPYVEGTDFEAAFSWTNKSHKLTARWPKGSKQPVVVGVFEGAASPLDAPAKGDAAKLCACFKKARGATSCEALIGAADPDCDRTYRDCESLLSCASGEPGFFPTCQPGYVNAGAMGRCYKPCGPGKDPCPAGTACSTDLGPAVCVEP